MEVEEIQNQGCKFPRIGNGRSDANKIRHKGEERHPNDEKDGDVKMSGKFCGDGESDIVAGGGIARLYGWPSSRIVRVSRASGGKDRHSKVWTSKGARDRRVRLSVTTAIQFYDLQDRLGYDQPSKAVEWLLKAAASSIKDLPSINTSFPDTPKQLGDGRRSNAGIENGLDSAEVELDVDQQLQQQNVSLSKSACSSTSETSKGSALSLSRSESRIKARERARERAAEKEKGKEKENESRIAHHQTLNPISQNSSFTELLTGGISSVSNNADSPTGSALQSHGGDESNLFHKSPRLWSSTPTDYFYPGLLVPSSSRTHHSTSGFSGQIHLGNSLSQSVTVSPFNVTGDHHPELQQFSFVPDHLIPVATAAGGSDCNLNFSAGFNRGTLQSNSPSLLPHLQRFSPVDGSNVPFFIGAVAPNAAPMENHHQFPPGFDGRFQFCYGNSGRHSDQKGKGKN